MTIETAAAVPLIVTPLPDRAGGDGRGGTSQRTNVTPTGAARTTIATERVEILTLDGYRLLRWRQSSRTYLTPPERPAAT
jgi:hypothetical protein